MPARWTSLAAPVRTQIKNAVFTKMVAPFCRSSSFSTLTLAPTDFKRSVTATPLLTDYGSFALENVEVQPDASGNANIVSAEEVALSLYYVDVLMSWEDTTNHENDLQ